MKWQITNARLFLRDDAHGLVMENGLIEELLPTREGLPDILSLDLHGMLLLPGMVNAHDSLMASYHPVEPLQFPYRNWLAFDNDVKDSELFEERMALDLRYLYGLGGYKNIISGATTVVDHIPDFVREAHARFSLAHVLPDYGISHSVCSYSLGWGEGHRREYEYACERDLPFIVHIAEGFDAESRDSLQALDSAGALGENTVLVHGISLSENDLDTIAQKGAHLVWCPVSNLRIYGKTLDVRAALDRGITVCLGTDSAMTGSLDLLYEMREADRYYSEQYGQKLPAEQISAMVLGNARRAFRIRDRGELSRGQIADLVVLRQNEATASDAEILLGASLSDVFLVVRNGQPIYGDADLAGIFDYLEIPYAKVGIAGTHKLIVAEYLDLISLVKKNSLSYRPFPFLPLEVGA